MRDEREKGRRGQQEKMTKEEEKVLWLVESIEVFDNVTVRNRRNDRPHLNRLGADRERTILIEN